MKQTLLALAASLLVPLAAMGAGEPDAKHGRAKSAGFTAPVSTNFQVRLLSGQREFVFSMYGAPGELGPLKQLVGVMREQQLGSTILPEPCSVRKTNS